MVELAVATVGFTHARELVWNQVSEPLGTELALATMRTGERPAVTNSVAGLLLMLEAGASATSSASSATVGKSATMLRFEFLTHSLRGADTLLETSEKSRSVVPVEEYVLALEESEFEFWGAVGEQARVPEVSL